MTLDEAIRWLRRLLGGAVLAALSAAAAQAAMFAVGIIIARSAGRQVFGDWALLYGTIVAGISFSSMGTGFTALRFTAEFRDRSPAELARILAPIHSLNVWMGAAAAVLTFAAAGPICMFVVRRPDLVWPLRECSVFVLFSVLALFWAGVLTGYERYTRQLVNNLIAALATLGCAFILIRSAGLTAPIVAGTVGAGTTLFLNRLAFSRSQLARNLAKASPGRETWREVLAILLPASLGGVVAAIAIWGAQLLLARHDIKGFALADFAAAYGLRNIAFFGVQFLNSAGAVVLSAALNADAGPSPTKFHQLTHGVTILAGAGVALILMIFPQTLLLIFGKGFVEASGVLRILALSIVFDAAGGSFYNVLLARRQLVANFWLAMLPREIARLGVCAVLVPLMGASGAAYGFLAAAIVFAVATGGQLLYPLVRSRLRSGRPE